MQANLFFRTNETIVTIYSTQIDMKKVLLMMVVMTTMVLSAVAQEAGPAKVPARRDLQERVLPNGDTLRVFLRGDEHLHWIMTEDGWQIVETNKGWFKYAKKNRKGEVVRSCRKAHNAEQRTKCEIKWLNKYGIKKNL